MTWQHVPAQYPENGYGDIAFVGEAPADQEVTKGIPLVGPSGRIFNAMLRTAGLNRSDYLVTNVFDEQLPDNEIGNWTVPLKEARERGWDDLPPIGGGFLHPDYRWHLDRLQEELLDVRPSVIVPLGGTALWAFTGNPNISAFRGSVTPATRLVPGAKLLPTFHPQFVQQQWKYYPIVVGDFLKAKAEADRGRKIILPHRELLIEPTVEDVRAYLPRLLSAELLSVDIETGWGQITSIQFAPDAEHAISIPFVDMRQLDRSYWRDPQEEVQVLRLVKQIMESPVPKLGQNFAQYDALWLLERYGIATRNLQHDTRLLHHALYPELPKDLAFMGASYSQQGAWKHWGHRAGTEKRDD